MIQRRVKCRGFKALSRVRRRLLQSIRTRDVLLTLPDRVVYIHQRFFNIHQPTRASERARRVWCAVSRLLQIHDGIPLSTATRLVIACDLRASNVAKRQSSTSIVSFQVSKMHAVCPEALRAIDPSAFFIIAGIRTLWRHTLLVTYALQAIDVRRNMRPRVLSSFSPERTKKVIALSYVERAFQCRSATDRRHTSSYDKMYFRGWEDREGDVYALRSFSWTGFQPAWIPEYQCLNIDSCQWHECLIQRELEKVYSIYSFIANLSILFDRITDNWGELNIDIILYLDLMNKRKKIYSNLSRFLYLYTYKILF